jgi:myxalamid-type polyketide synthase MxaE and MxaD
MDALAHHRRATGYPALSINWGRWAEVGQATLRDRSERLDSRGFASMKPKIGLTILGRVLQQSTPQIGVMSFNLHKWSQFYPKLRNSSLFADLTQEETSIQGRENGSQTSHLTREMLLSMDTKQRSQAAEKYLIPTGVPSDRIRRN